MLCGWAPFADAEGPTVTGDLLVGVRSSASTVPLEPLGPHHTRAYSVESSKGKHIPRSGVPGNPHREPFHHRSLCTPLCARTAPLRGASLSSRSIPVVIGHRAPLSVSSRKPSLTPRALTGASITRASDATFSAMTHTSSANFRPKTYRSLSAYRRTYAPCRRAREVRRGAVPRLTKARR